MDRQMDGRALKLHANEEEGKKERKERKKEIKKERI